MPMHEPLLLNAHPGAAQGSSRPTGIVSRRFTKTVLVTFALTVPPMAAAIAQPTLTADGTEFVLTTDAGQVMRGADLVGATIRLRVAGRPFEITIESAQEDRKSVGYVLLHHFVARNNGGPPSDLCSPDAEGRSLGFPVPSGNGNFDITCTSGAVGKCVRFGYRPWEEVPDGPPLKALHQACIHMVRADYGGDGKPSTRNATLIDIYDRWGIQTTDGIGSMTFEAAWGVDGAVCVAHPRVPENISLQELEKRYPRLEAHLGPAVCTEKIASHDRRTMLFNRSRE
jgi:hypothetical protein